MFDREPKWGPTGEPVYQRTYRREKANGELEQWHDTVARVVDGNLSLVGKSFIEPGERQALLNLFYDFKALPAGRHLWMSGVPGRQFLFNCHHSGWTEDVAYHFQFTFDQLMQGGGVGANYSSRYLIGYGPVKHTVDVQVVCDTDHPDWQELFENNLLSTEYSPNWTGAVRVGDTREDWSNALGDLLRAFFNGQTQIVFDLSLIRKRGSKIKTFGGTAAGPAPLALMLKNIALLLNEREGKHLDSLTAMAIDHYVAECVVSGNVRRSARMSIKNWSDADIIDFINCKEDGQHHWSTNISVEIDDTFFKALKRKDAHAMGVYEAAVTAMLKNGEPGFYNRSLAQVGEVREVASTNPCGEIALEQFENCNLGHVNLDAFAGDFQGAAEAHRLMTRYLIRATFGDVPNEKQAEVLARNRRIGVGHFGYQGWVVKQGVRYSDSHRDPKIRKTLKDFYNTVRKEARRYAFQLRIPEPIKVTTVAPTGTIAKMPGRTEGIHPIYAKYFIRRVRFSTVDPEQIAAVERYRAKGDKVEGCIYSKNTVVVEFVTKESLVEEVELLGLDADYLVESADEIPFGDMLAVQAMYQECYADNAVSYTINIPADTLTVAEVKATLIHYLPRVKGTTIMVDESREQAPYERLTLAEYEAASRVHIADAVDDECATGACPVR